MSWTLCFLALMLGGGECRLERRLLAMRLMWLTMMVPPRLVVARVAIAMPSSLMMARRLVV